MSRMLVIESSARQEGSVSRQLTRRLVDAWQARHATDTVVWRDLAAQPVPHLDADLLQAWMQPADQLSTPQQQALQRSDRLIEELLAADVLVIAAPMYNFMIPSTLKAWFDHVLRAGVTFRYGANGPEGLLRGKRAVVLTACGGIYAGGPQDLQEPYLRQLLAFIGIHQVDFVHAEGQSLGQPLQQEGLDKALGQLAALG